MRESLVRSGFMRYIFVTIGLLFFPAVSFALPSDLVDQLKNALLKPLPSSVTRITRTQYYRDIEEDRFHVFFQSYEVWEGIVIVSSFSWLGNVNYINKIQGELFDLMDNYGKPAVEQKDEVVWIDGYYKIRLGTARKQDDGNFTVDLIVLIDFSNFTVEN